MGCRQMQGWLLWHLPRCSCTSWLKDGYRCGLRRCMPNMACGAVALRSCFLETDMLACAAAAAVPQGHEGTDA